MFLKSTSSILISSKLASKLYQNCMKFSIFSVNRSLLSENYFCNEEWDKYLSKDLIRKIDLTTFSTEVEDKLLRKKLVTPLDIEILASKIGYADNVEQLEYIENIFVDFRKTQAALFVKDSTHHGFVRSYIDLDQINKLLNILTYKYKYGIYLDTYNANRLMDVLLEDKSFTQSAQIAVEVMLQEFNDNPITLGFCLLSSWKYLNSVVNNPNATVESIDSESSADKDSKQEKLLVNFLRNPYFDDHFDIKNFQHLIGKTIYFSAINLRVEDSLVVDSLKIYGLLIFEKYEKILKILENMKRDNKKILKFVANELDNKIQNIISKSDSEKQIIEDLLKSYKKLDIKSLTSSQEVDIDKELEKILLKAIDENSNKDIKEQRELFEKWSNEQDVEIKQQVKNFLIEEKKKKIFERLEKLERQEEILNFFDHRDKIRMYAFNKGFPRENPTNIPIEPEESEYKILAERHFKTWKNKNKPAHLLKKSNTQALMEDSLSKIYLNNKKE